MSFNMVGVRRCLQRMVSVDNRLCQTGSIGSVSLRQEAFVLLTDTSVPPAAPIPSFSFFFQPFSLFPFPIFPYIFHSILISMDGLSVMFVLFLRHQPITFTLGGGGPLPVIYVLIWSESTSHCPTTYAHKQARVRCNVPFAWRCTEFISARLE